MQIRMVVVFSPHGSSPDLLKQTRQKTKRLMSRERELTKFPQDYTDIHTCTYTIYTTQLCIYLHMNVYVHKCHLQRPLLHMTCIQSCYILNMHIGNLTTSQNCRLSGKIKLLDFILYIILGLQDMKISRQAELVL